MAHIKQINITDSGSYLIEPTLYAAATVNTDGTAYTASFGSNFELVKGVCVQIKCPNTTNTAPTTFNTKNIYYNGAAIASNTLKANHTYALVYDGTQWQLVGDIDTNSNTTYTFTSGTNSFTVTPSSGNAQTVTVTPSITNNITGSGTSGRLVKFNGTNTITDGPTLGTDATKFLNNKGEWATPSYTTNTDEKVKQTPTTTDASYEILFSESANNDQKTEGARKTSTLKYNPNSKTLTIDSGTITGTDYSGKAATAGTADSANAVAWDKVSSKPSTATRWPKWSEVTDKKSTLSGYGITDAHINTTSGVITLGSNTITPITSVNGYIGPNVSITAGDLGLASALKYVGTKSSLPDATNNTTYSTYNNGDVITVSNKEYAYVKGNNAANSSWVELGDEGSYKLKQTAFTNNTGTADGTNTSTTFIYSLSQDVNGTITEIKTRQLPTYNNYSHPSGDGNLHVPATGTTNKGKFLKVTNNTAGSIGWASLVKADITDFSHTHSSLATVGDTRNNSTTPNTYNNKLEFEGLKTNTKIGSPHTDTYSYVVGLRGWTDSQGGDAHELAFNGNGIYRRQGATSTWGNWFHILDSGNTSAADAEGNTIFLARNTETTIATINGVPITIKIPASDNSWRPVGTGANDAAAGNHTHGNITNGGCVTTAITLAENDYILVGDSSASGKVGKGPIFSAAISNQTTSTEFLRKDGSWAAPSYYSHPTSDGSKHVPANGTGNNGKFLQATGTAGTYQWASLPTASTDTAGIIQIGTGASNAMAGNKNVTQVAISADTTTNKNYAIVFGTTASDGTNPTAAKTEGLQKNSAKLYYNPSTGNLVSTKFNNLTLTAATTGFTIAGGSTTSKTLTVNETYTLNAACAKAVDSSISAGSTSEKLPTSKAVATFVEGKGYLTSQWSVILYTASSASNKAQVTAAQTNPYLNLVENDTIRSSTRLSGSGATTVTSSADGKTITISSTDNNNAVTQSASTSSKWHKILVHHKEDDTSTADVTSQTNVVYASKYVAVSPQEGKIRATSYLVNDKVTLQYNSTDQSLDFVFA